MSLAVLPRAIAVSKHRGSLPLPEWYVTELNADHESYTVTRWSAGREGALCIAAAINEGTEAQK